MRSALAPVITLLSPAIHAVFRLYDAIVPIREFSATLGSAMAKTKTVSVHPQRSSTCSQSGRRSTDPLVHTGRHFGRTVHALSVVHHLLVNGVVRLGELNSGKREDEYKPAYV